MPGRPAPEDAAVSDVLGSILLVGITVAMAVAFGAVVLAYDGPPRLTRAEVAAAVDPGAGGWATGDETVRLIHRGGDPLEAAQTRVIVNLGGASTTLTGAAQLGSVFADGRLTIGETWQYPATIPQGQTVQVRVVSSAGDAAVLVANSAIVAAQTTSTQPCTSDATPPTANWVQSPALLSATTSGAVQLSIQLVDDCWGVNNLAVAPTLHWRLAEAESTSTALRPYAAASVAPAGPPNTFSATIPAQAWASRAGWVLQYYLAPVRDLGGNAGETAVRSVPILADCTSDVTAPALAAVAQSPADVRSNTATAVVVTVTFADDCAGVRDAIDPHLWWSINPGTAFQDATSGGMSKVSGQAHTWRGTIEVPSPSWGAHAGAVLEYYVAGHADANGNVGTSGTQSDPIELVANYAYPASATPTTGTIDTVPPLQSATDLGAFSTLSEAAAPGPPTTQSFNANVVVNSNGWATATPTRLGASDDQYATYSADGPAAVNALQVALADPVTTTGAITRVVLSAEVAVTGYANDGFRLQGCLTGGACTAATSIQGTSATDSTLTYDITALKPGAAGSAWTWTDVTNLQGLVLLAQQGQRDGTWRVDRVFADVTFQVSAHSLSIRLDWTAIPTGGLSPSLELRYNTAGDTFRVEACALTAAGACTGTWASKGTLTASGGMATFEVALASSEVAAGRAAIRLVDQTSSGSTQGFLYIDYARVATQ